ncbi:MAG: NADH-quinone oxidoreductase subunit K [Candidatus Terraquivivens tikiterensis]|uniref:NADH-quinone oxidoreductase subunit K n=1 Tax=Candidatus Terraquivivens tikiterensis TaxID=1980982 RepID=A0A2R7Y395_9ARCH|nr:MAG: NADH-quinone oxidoreductase subunit K [Candidatus Terraquivivens tikiterensis]
MALYVLYYVLAAVLLFIIGVYTLTTKRSIIKMIIGIEIMINAAHLNFIALSTNFPGGVVDPFAQSVVLISMAVGAAVIALALLLSVHVYRTYKTLDITLLRRLRR